MLTLKKHRVTIPRLAKELLEPEFAVKVESLLGYKLAGQTAIQQQTLASVLKELDISVFNSNSVESYKERQRRNMQALEKHSWRKWGWHRIELKRYQRAVPLRVLQLAMRIAERLPRARFGVDELVRVHSKRPRLADPFLVVSMGSARYYIAQWDEPTFSDEN